MYTVYTVLNSAIHKIESEYIYRTFIFIKFICSTLYARECLAHLALYHEPPLEVAIAKRSAWEECSRDLGTLEGRHKMFKVAKQMRNSKRDVVGTNFIKDENGNIRIEEEDVREQWRGYFQTLLNEENDYELEEVKCSGRSN
jgi:hypothetical protein